MAYARPESLVETDWVSDHLTDPTVRFVEVDTDTWSYDDAHIPGALAWDWARDLSDQLTRDVLSTSDFEKLMGRSGISAGTTVVLYGDNHNWFACWAFWQMKIYGHVDVRMMNGGRAKWLSEGRDVTTDVPTPTPTTYVAKAPDWSIRAMLSEVRSEVAAGAVSLIDVRSPAEFAGDLLAPPGLPETCQRGGHIPGARNVPWGAVCNADGTFLSAEALRALYGGKGISDGIPVIAYCRIGERSSHTWYALQYLMGHPNVRNYDGSWTEWGNLVGAHVERGSD